MILKYLFPRQKDRNLRLTLKKKCRKSYGLLTNEVTVQRYVHLDNVTSGADIEIAENTASNILKYLFI